MPLAEIRHKLIAVFICLAAMNSHCFAQDTSSSDGLLQQARKAAFDNKDYPRAKAYLKKALSISPGYADVKIFLGRIYTWTDNPDSARYFFTDALKTKPGYEDAFVAYSDLEFFNDQYDRALEICKKGLRSNPASEALMLREAKILNAQKKPEEADRSLQKLLLLNKNNEEAKALAKKIQNDRNRPDSIMVITRPANISNQDSLSADGLLLLARKAAFDEKNYGLAKSRLYRALKISPDYADVKIFLGRIHTWSKEYDSARYYFHAVLQKTPDYADASAALADLEYWNDDNSKALQVVSDGLKYHASSEELLVRKARILNNMRRYAEAQDVVDKALQVNRNNTEARSLANRIKESSVKNKIGLSYDYVYFDKQFSNPWQLAAFDYTRTTGIGSITGRINYANRFTENGVQYEVEAYPRISNMFYSYVSAGYSDKVGVFPQWRGGFSLYANLPKSYEGELGFRYLKFSGTPTWIYTGYLGKYYKSWLFGLRAYLTPSSFTSTASTSYTASARYYYGSADDLVGITAGYGISPDDRLNSVQLDGSIRLVSYKAGISFKKKISRSNVLSADFSWFNQEYLPQTKGNQYQISAGWLHRF